MHPHGRVQIGNAEGADGEVNLRPAHDHAVVVNGNGVAVGSPQCAQILQCAIESPEKRMILGGADCACRVRDGGVGGACCPSTVVDAVGYAAVAAKCAEVVHHAVFPKKGMFLFRHRCGVGRTHDFSPGVDAAGSTVRAAKGAEVEDIAFDPQEGTVGPCREQCLPGHHTCVIDAGCAWGWVVEVIERTDVGNRVAGLRSQALRYRDRKSECCGVC